ncbi:MAG TPA: glycosyltransferase family 2 protein, partial [Tissierellaceae bacterium]
DYILLLNNDTEVERNFLSEMLTTAEEDENIGIVGCKIKYFNDKNLLWYAGGEIKLFKYIGSNEGIKKIDNGFYDQKKEITFVTGCCMLIKRKVFEKLGLLSDECFMYFEDVDFCVRVQEAGFKIIYEPKAVIYHKVGKSGGGEESPFFIKWSTRNRIYFMHKFKYKVNRPQFLISNIFFYTTRLVRIIQYYLKGDKKRAIAIIQGIKEGRSMSSRN